MQQFVMPCTNLATGGILPGTTHCIGSSLTYNSNYHLKYTSVSTQSDNLLSSLTCPSGCNLGCSLPLPNVLFHCQLRQIFCLSGVAFIILISRSLWMEICSLALGWACGQVLSLIFSSYYILQNAHRRTKYLGSFYRQWRETVPSRCKTS